MDLARLTVDLAALRANYRTFAGTAPGAGAVVKADGYGLGARRIAEALCQGGCVDFFVATVAEGLDLAGRVGEGRVYVFSGPMDADDAGRMAANGLTPVLNDSAQVGRWQHYRHLPAAVHVDTGMRRLGFDSRSFDPGQFDGLLVTLVLSHLANADRRGDPLSDRQAARFSALTRLFPEARTSLGNSAGVLSGIGSDVARPGIALYGGNPFSTGRSPMRPVATLEARVVGLRTVRPGEPVGYDGTFRTARKTRVAVLGIGYADGVPRAISNRGVVAHRGQRLPVIGRISMDLMHVDVTAARTPVAVGDWLEVFGHTVRVDDVAAAAGTIPYEVLTGIGSRVVRDYRDG
ncbi:MAG: alanine racemase [Gammaproteobacteria bacterium]|nr:alanine racemase [Gammaproteobacteria bacterium]